VQHQQLPEAVGLRGVRERGIPLDEVAELVRPDELDDPVVVLPRLLREPVRAVGGVTVAVVGARDERDAAIAGGACERGARAYGAPLETFS